MPSRPAKITAFDASGLHVANQLFREIEGRLDDLQKQIPAHQTLKATGTLVFGTVPAQSTTEATLYVPGAHTSGAVHVSPAQGLPPAANISWCGRVSKQNQVVIRVTNPTGAGIAVKTALWNVTVVQ